MVIYEVTTLYMLDTNMTYDIYSYYMQSTDCIISTREITLKEFTNEWIMKLKGLHKNIRNYHVLVFFKEKTRNLNKRISFRNW